MPYNERFVSELEEIRSNGNERLLTGSDRQGRTVTIGNKELIDLTHNDYLGLSTHPDILKASSSAKRTGSGGSRLLGGNSAEHEQLEHDTAAFKTKEDCVLFNSGYQCNIGLFSALARPGDAVICDKLSHASIIDGIRLSGANMLRYRHNSLEDLEKAIIKAKKVTDSIIVSTEALFSMDGDTAPLDDICALKDKYGFLMIVDEAHSTGVYGKKGAGIVSELGLSDRVDVVMGTYSKALGSYGGYAATSQLIKRYLINRSRAFIYSTALPHAVIKANMASLKVCAVSDDKRAYLSRISKDVLAAVRKKGLPTPSGSHIIPVMTGSNEKAAGLAEHLIASGFYARPIRYPTVPKGLERVRISLNSMLREEDIAGLIASLNEY